MRKLSKIAGVTLIEMMVGVVVSTIMIAAMYTTYNIINSTYSQVTDVASISRSGRDVVAMMMRDIRMAGFKYYYGYNSENEAKDIDARIPREDYLEFVPGDTEDTIKDSHAPIVIYRNVLNYAYPITNGKGVEPDMPGFDGITKNKDKKIKFNHLKGEDPSDYCCDRIHIVYGDFDASDDAQPYKRYRITYFARPLQKNNDQYYGIFRSKEYWKQEKGQDEGDWIADPAECGGGDCYAGELIREYLTDMSFVAIGKYGEVINANPKDNQDRIYDIRAVDVTLTFRSSAKKGFYRGLSNKPRIVQSLGRKLATFTDKWFRDTIFVTIHTRNIGSAF